MICDFKYEATFHTHALQTNPCQSGSVAWLKIRHLQACCLRSTARPCLRWISNGVLDATSPLMSQPSLREGLQWARFCTTVIHFQPERPCQLAIPRAVHIHCCCTFMGGVAIIKSVAASVLSMHQQKVLSRPAWMEWDRQTGSPGIFLDPSRARVRKGQFANQARVDIVHRTQIANLHVRVA